MKLILGSYPHYDKYEVVIDFMHGDADADSTESFMFSSKKELTNFITDLDSLHNHYQPDEDGEINHLKHLYAKIGDYWPKDSTSNGSCDAAYNGYNVYYYNQNGAKL